MRNGGDSPLVSEMQRQDEWTFEAVDRMIRATERTASATETIRAVVVALAVLVAIGLLVLIIGGLG